ncbi:MAG: hypothetical protein FIA97_14785, partial [Methylococcaceae bacterium]|nr:hypothetical protein [Methylococcaceae bacterium]
MPSEFPSLRRWIMRLAPLLLLNNPASAKQPFELMVLANNGAPSRTTTDNSGYPAVSADGQYVTFVSSADDLVATATTLPNIFLRASGRTALISADSDGKEGKDVSGEISDVSDDGCVVAFETAASLVKTDTNGVKDIYLR